MNQASGKSGFIGFKTGATGQVNLVHRIGEPGSPTLARLDGGER